MLRDFSHQFERTFASRHTPTKGRHRNRHLFGKGVMNSFTIMIQLMLLVRLSIDGKAQPTAPQEGGESYPSTLQTLLRTSGLNDCEQCAICPSCFAGTNTCSNGEFGIDQPNPVIAACGQMVSSLDFWVCICTNQTTDLTALIENLVMYCFANSDFVSLPNPTAVLSAFTNTICPSILSPASSTITSPSASPNIVTDNPIPPSALTASSTVYLPAASPTSSSDQSGLPTHKNN